MQKQIAVFICAISFDNQRKVLEGILKCAKEYGVNVFVFTCHVGYMEATATRQGAFNIMNLPDIENFDGVIIMKNSIQYEKVTQKLIKKILKSKVPAVSIDVKITGMKYIGISNYQAQRDIIEHLIEEHQMRRINYITGSLFSADAAERYQAYQDVINENEIPYDPNRVYYGNYDTDTGRKAVEHFLSVDAVLPDAIVCANDCIALGVIEKIVEHGYRVPEDVAVTGFDCDEMGQSYIPALATVDRKQEDVGYYATKMLVDAESTEQEYNKEVETQLILGESCGCKREKEEDFEVLKMKYVRQNIIFQQAVDATKKMALDLTGLENVDDLYEALKKYVMLADMESFYLCMCDENKIFHTPDFDKRNKVKLQTTNENYSEKVSVAIAYANGKFYKHDKINSGEVLSRDMISEDKWSYYIVAPVYFRNCCFGYCVSQNSDFVLKSELFYSWVVNIGIGLENIRKYTLLNDVATKLNNMWVYDMLTGIYNRAGFFHYAESLMNEMIKENAKAFLLFMDMDGLKKVNDSYGHEEGDRCICTLADVLRKSIQPNDLLMRYGGDEFVIFGKCDSEQEVENRMYRIHDELNEINRDTTRKYRVETSIGKHFCNAKEIGDLNKMIENADRKMYQDKMKKRKR